MIGIYDFAGHYEWTFAWLERQGGPELVRAYWDEAIHLDSQTHARDLIVNGGFEGMKTYWGHTLKEEAAEYTTAATETVFRIDMHDCPTKGFLLRNDLHQHPDYCDHCMGWIGPLMREAGFTIDHQHNHRGQCWWEIRRADQSEAPSAPGTLAGKSDIRLQPGWDDTRSPIDTFLAANSPDDKEPDHR